MTYNSKAKTKVLYLWKILQEETDAEHGLTMSQIIQKLADYGVSAERKSIYGDIKSLREFDVDVQTFPRNPVEYAIVRRDFTLDELMLLVDTIQSSRAITERQAKALITNVKQLANNREQDLLDRRIHVTGRIKSKSESVLSTVDVIHEAMRKDCQLEFSYRKIGVDGKPYETRGGKKHQVTPVAISYEDGLYYLTAWNDAHENLTTFRLDRMARIRVLEDIPAAHNDRIDHFQHESAKAVMFGRFCGDTVLATFAADPSKVEILADRFGDAAQFLPTDGSEARCQVKVYKSEQLFGWVASMGKAVRILSPQNLVDEYYDYLRFLLEDA